MKKDEKLTCLCGGHVRAYGGSSYYFVMGSGEKKNMYSCSLGCTNPECGLKIPRGKWKDSHEEAKKDAIERWRKALCVVKKV